MTVVLRFAVVVGLLLSSQLSFSIELKSSHCHAHLLNASAFHSMDEIGKQNTEMALDALEKFRLQILKKRSVMSSFDAVEATSSEQDKYEQIAGRIKAIELGLRNERSGPGLQEFQGGFIITGTEAIADYYKGVKKWQNQIDSVRMDQGVKQILSVGVSSLATKSLIVGSSAIALNLINHSSDGHELATFINLLLDAYVFSVDKLPGYLSNIRSGADYEKTVEQYSTSIPEPGSWHYRGTNGKVVHEILSTLQDQKISQEKENDEEFESYLFTQLTAEIGPRFITHLFAPPMMMLVSLLHGKPGRFLDILKAYHQDHALYDVQVDELLLTDPQSGEPGLIVFLRSHKKMPPRPRRGKKVKQTEKSKDLAPGMLPSLT